MSSIIKLKPIFKEKIWGGTGIRKEYGFRLPSDHIGEAWMISGHPHGDNLIANGEYKGMTLSQLYASHRELFADDPRSAFPLLVKIIDASADLSVQVHPDNDYALLHENSYGKSESWVILKADKESRLQLGHKAKDRKQLVEMIDNKKWDDLLVYVPVSKNEVIDVPPGTLHALCAGVMILEIQQSSDITYRVYDYDRPDEKGNMRPLHLNQAKDVITAPHPDSTVRKIKWNCKNSHVEHIIVNPYFVVEQWKTVDHLYMENGKSLYYLVTVIKGEGTVNGTKVAKGDGFIILSDCRKINIKGTLDLVAAYPVLTK